MLEKKKYVEQLTDLLNQWEDEIDQSREKSIGSGNKELAKRSQQSRARMRHRCFQLRKQLEDIQEINESDWISEKENVDSSLRDLKKAFLRARMMV